MCVSPPDIPGVGLVACRECWQCRKDRVNDYIGRCIAESQHTAQTLALTLTYGGGDTTRAATLVYADVQKFLKRLRKDYKVRYLCVGEFGTRHGRAHWHIILFFEKPIPTVNSDREWCMGASDPRLKQNKRHVVLTDPKILAHNKLCAVPGSKRKKKPHAKFDWFYWPHGFCEAQIGDRGSFRYAMDYVLKDQKLEISDTHLAMSKKPLLGYQFICDEAQYYVDKGLAPRDAKIAIRGHVNAKGKHETFKLKGKSRELFASKFEELWEKQRGLPIPQSDFLDAVLRPEDPGELEITDEMRNRIVKRFQDESASPLKRKPNLVPFHEWGMWGVLDGKEVAISLHQDGMIIYDNETDSEVSKSWPVENPEVAVEVLQRFEPITVHLKGVLGVSALRKDYRGHESVYAKERVQQAIRALQAHGFPSA